MGLGRMGSELRLKNVAEIAHLSVRELALFSASHQVGLIGLCMYPSDAQQQSKHRTSPRTCIL